MVLSRPKLQPDPENIEIELVAAIKPGLKSWPFMNIVFLLLLFCRSLFFCFFDWITHKIFFFSITIVRHRRALQEFLKFWAAAKRISLTKIWRNLNSSKVLRTSQFIRGGSSFLKSFLWSGAQELVCVFQGRFFVVFILMFCSMHLGGQENISLMMVEKGGNIFECCSRVDGCFRVKEKLRFLYRSRVVVLVFLLFSIRSLA